MSNHSHKKHSNSSQANQIKQSNLSNKHSPSGSLSLKNKLVNFLIQTSQIQRKLQIIKQTICQQQSFTPQSVFNRIDQERKGYILQKDLLNFLTDNKIQFKGSQLKILYGKMNVDQSDQGVLLWEFQNFILPNQNPKLRYLTIRRPVYIPLPNQKLPQKIQWLISKLFVQIMKEQPRLNQVNASLISSYDFSPVTIFNLLANLQGFITGQSLNNFMYNQNCQVSIEQIGCLMRLIDKHGQGRICLQDFKFFLATMRLKKQHEIFDQLSPIPALKNFVVPLLESILNRQGTLKERVINNKMNGRSPDKGLTSSIRRSSQKTSNSKRNN